MKREKKISLEYTSNSKKKKRKIIEAYEQEEIERNNTENNNGCHLVDSSGSITKNEIGTVIYDLSEAIEFDPRLIE